VTGRAGGPVARRAVRYLRTQQNRDGGFGQMDGRDSNSQSTSYAVQGLAAVGSGGEMVGRALGYLRRRQAADGSVAYSADSQQTPVWVTAQALMALRRAALPIAAVARAPKPKPASASAAAAPKPEKKARRAKRRHRKAQQDGDGGGGGRVKLDADVEDDSPPPGSGISVDRERASESSGGGLAPWLIIGGGILVVGALGPFRSRLLRLVRRS